MILEGVVTTIDVGGEANVSPMGPIVDSQWSKLRLRPFQSSRTYQNLKRKGEGVLHVTDDVQLIAAAAIGRLKTTPPVRPAATVDGWILEDTCRWYEFRVIRLNDEQARTEIDCEIVTSGRQRDFFGFNRAKHAVIEAAILATRLHLLPKQQILDDYKRLASPVEKTAGEAELAAFAMLREHVEAKLRNS